MTEYEEKLKQFLKQRQSKARHFSFGQSCHSVADAADTAGVDPRDLVKSICMLDSGQNIIVTIVKGEDRASTSRVAKALDIERPRMASPEEILARTGFPCGGTPPFGFAALFLIDPKVLDMDNVYAGGGSDTSLVRISPQELLTLNRGKVVRVRK